MQKNKIIAPSTERAKSLNEILMLEKDISSCTNLLHVDIMDGKFVDRVLLGKQELEALSKELKIKLDFHLMCDFSSSEQELDFYIGLKPEIISVHLEAFKDQKSLINALNKIKNAGIKPSVAVKIETEISQVFEVLPYVDMVLVMSVKVGQGGQAFDEFSVQKIEKLKQHLALTNQQKVLQVDGGINQTNAKMLFEKGVDILVCGSYVFNSEDRCKTINNLINL